VAQEPFRLCASGFGMIAARDVRGSVAVGSSVCHRGVRLVWRALGCASLLAVFAVARWFSSPLLYRARRGRRGASAPSFLGPNRLRRRPPPSVSLGLALACRFASCCGSSCALYLRPACAGLRPRLPRVLVGRADRATGRKEPRPTARPPVRVFPRPVIRSAS